MSQIPKLKTNRFKEVNASSYLAVLVVYLNPVNWVDSKRKDRSLIYWTAKLSGYSSQNALLLVQQSNLETGYQQKGFYNTQNNNLFGMHYPRVRESINCGYMPNEAENGEMSVYCSARMAIVDRILWDNYNDINPQSLDYLEDIVEKGYNPSPEYPDRVENTVTALYSFNDLLTQNRKKAIAVLIALLFVLLGVGYLYAKLQKKFKW